MKPKIVVVGAGVSGLSSACRLLERGLEVEVWTRDVPGRTTSSTAAAFWYPYLVQPEEAGLRWGGASFREFVRLADVPEAGIRMRRSKVLFPAEVADPVWRGEVPTFRRARPDELPEGSSDGFVMELPVVEMPIYLRYLVGRVEGLGGAVRIRSLASLDEASEEAEIVVNCAGLGARELADDPSMYAIRGQLLRVECRAVKELIFDPYGTAGVSYIVPREDDCVLGGTNEEGVESLAPDPATTEAIFDRCARLEPHLSDARRLGESVGLRPCRPSVRLEAEIRGGGGLLVHNYGHGGAGVTLSWGCADEVAGLVREHLRGHETLISPDPQGVAVPTTL